METILVKLNFEGETKPLLFKKGKDGFYRATSFETGKKYTYSLNVLKSFLDHERQ